MVMASVWPCGWWTWTKYGDIYDCIDFYKQPTFDHPLLKNHTYNFQHAVIRTINPKRKYNGVGGITALYNPHLGHTDQYSSARIKIQNGGDSIQVGWTVNPTLYGDNRTRFFTYLNAGQSHCFNTQCNGFIIVNNDIPLDFVFDTISDGVVIYDWKFFIYRDSATGDWWLNFGSKDTQVGFWPKRIFTSLGNLASYIDWGGEVYSSPNEPAPYMGSGHPPYGDTRYDAFCRQATFVNEAHEIVYATDTEPYVDAIHYYGVLDFWTTNSNLGHIVTFGGGLWLNRN